MTAPLRLMLVDDSSTFLRMVRGLAKNWDDVEVVGEARSLKEAFALLETCNPDVCSVDLHLGDGTGDKLVEHINGRVGTTAIYVTSVGTRQSAVDQLIATGAADVLPKPGADSGLDRPTFGARLRRAVLDAAGRTSCGRRGVAERMAKAEAKTVQSVIAIGSSTGGTEAVGQVLASLPAGLPPVLLVQHMPSYGVHPVVEQWNARSALNVIVAPEATALRPGTVYVAPGDRHLELRGQNGRVVVRTRPGPPISGHCPSVDVLFRSVARAGLPAVGVILTGMGEDGAAGLLAMRNAGAKTIGQDAATSKVYGMPKAAKRLGAVGVELPLSQIADGIAGAARTQKKAG